MIGFGYDHLLLLPVVCRMTAQANMIENPSLNSLFVPSTRQSNRQVLHRYSQQFAPMIRAELQSLAQALWPSRVWNPIRIFRTFRLRSLENDQEVTWWIEHDIPPYDLYRCAAIEVRLSISNNLKPSLVVASREHLYKVDPISATSLHRALIAAGLDSPRIISRRMGAANDP